MSPLGLLAVLRRAVRFGDLPFGERVALGVLAAMLVVFPWVVGGGFSRAVMVQFLLYALYGISWNFIGGFGGQVDLGGAKSVGFGAYAVALSMAWWDVPFLLSLPAGVLVAVLEALVLGSALLRLRGHYFAIGTLSVALVWQELFVFWEWTGGARGVLLPIRRPPDLGHMQLSPVGYHYLILGLAALAFLCLNGLRNAPLGYQLRAIKANEAAAASLGIDVFRTKLKAYCISAALYALGGGFYAAYFRYVDPFAVMPMDLSILIAMTAMLGGAGSLWGPVIGAGVLIPLDRYLGAWLGGGGIRGVDFVIYAIIIMALAAYQPRGIWGIVESLRMRRRRRAELPLLAAPGVGRAEPERPLPARTWQR